MARVAIFWSSFPGYITKCIETLADVEGTEVIAGCQSSGTSQNFIDRLRSKNNIKIICESQKITSLNRVEIIKDSLFFQADISIFSLTRFGIFADIARALRKQGTMVVAACDHFWKNTWRDYANLVASRCGLFQKYEAMFVPGRAGKIFAQKLGFKETVIFEGMYTADVDVFRPIGIKRHSVGFSDDWPKVFLFVGQFIYRKGIDELMQAYSKYRSKVSHPWELWLIGRGDLENLVTGVPGVRNLGFKDPLQVAEAMSRSGCLILPSREDHWGLVIHEATCAGLPIIASSNCGSCPELVQNGLNGYTFPPEDTNMLLKLMELITEKGSARQMGQDSLQMSYRYSPNLWVQRILTDIPFILRGENLIS